MRAESGYLRPSWFVNHLFNPLVDRLGLVPTLAVRGRRSGRWRQLPVNVLDLDGQRYLVAPRGVTEWVRNLRTAGDGALRHRGRVEVFRAVEVAGAEASRAIDAYRARWGWQVEQYFAALPEPTDHPVFRLERT